jgi:protein TonB
MFKVVAERRKRRVWSSRTVAASVVFHLLLLAGFVSAAENREPQITVTDFDIGAAPEAPRTHVETPPPPRPKTDETPVVKGRTVAIEAPDQVPTEIPKPDLTATPLTAEMVTGIGPVGSEIGTNPGTAATTTPSGNGDGNLPVFDRPLEVTEVDALPELANRRDAERALQRNYPPLMRDAGVTGHTVVLLIIDKDGKVEPGSVQVQNSSHEGFADAAVKAVERFRFKPATLHGRAVPVLISIPIDWQLEN